MILVIVQKCRALKMQTGKVLEKNTKESLIEDIDKACANR